jgi:disulfide bond formation protein DsbB
VTEVVETTDRRRWLLTAILLAVVYCAVGVVFQGQFAWRLAAWVVSAAAYVGHLAYEHGRLRNPPRIAALHAAASVALGAFGLAVAATLHRAFSAESGANMRLYALALVVWPLITGVPAFIVALVLSEVLARLPRRA